MTSRQKKRERLQTIDRALDRSSLTDLRLMLEGTFLGCGKPDAKVRNLLRKKIALFEKYDCPRNGGTEALLRP